MKALYDLPAPAKLNLFLHVTGRRGDGYHLLQSVFMLVDWCDTLHMEPRRDGVLSREDLQAPLPADDLVLRAARALQALAPPGAGAHIAIAKRIPAQAGMGGGSSDAATCLLGLNRLWQLDLPLARLEAIGLQLGADVPFFLRGHNAWVEGIGEKITPVALPRTDVVVVRPGAGIDTKSIFVSPDLERSTTPAIISGFAACAARGEQEMFEFGRNDLQPVAQRLCPEVAQAIEWLGARGLKARMTGSGSAVFAPLPAQPAPGQEHGGRQAAGLREADLSNVPKGWTIRQCSNMSVHPLAGWAGSDNS